MRQAEDEDNVLDKFGYMLETPKAPCTNVPNTGIIVKIKEIKQWTISRKGLRKEWLG